MSADDDRVGSAGQTSAEVLNGASLTGPHSRDRQPPEPPPSPPPADTQPEENAASVRAYTWTGGRTRSDLQLEIETLVSTTARAEALMPTLRVEHQTVARLCHSKSVAEVGALLSLPLGVVRVLLGDMAGLGLIEVHGNPVDRSERPNLELLERVRRGLTNLNT